MCECHSRGSWGRKTTWKKHRKKTGIDTKIQESSALQCPGLSPGITAEPPKLYFVTAAKPGGRGGWDQLNPNTLRGFPIPRNSANQSPFQNILLLEPKLEDFHAPSRKGECRKLQQGEGKCKKEFNRDSHRESSSALGSCNKQQETWKQQEKEWMGSAKKYSLLQECMTDFETVA